MCQTASTVWHQASLSLSPHLSIAPVLVRQAGRQAGGRQPQDRRKGRRTPPPPGYRIFFRARSSVSLTERRTSFVFIELRENDGLWRARTLYHILRPLLVHPFILGKLQGSKYKRVMYVAARCTLESRRSSESFRTPTGRPTLPSLLKPVN